MTTEEKLALDIKDFWRISDGIEAYSTSDVAKFMERLKAHKEDQFCTVTDFKGKQQIQCTRDAYDAASDLAERHISSLPSPDDYAVGDLAETIRKHYVRIYVEEGVDEPALARLLSVATAEVEKKHIQRTYHMACVITQTAKPDQFRVGNVTFTSAAALPVFLAKQYEQFLQDDAEHGQGALDKFGEYVKKFGWVASVTVPPCARDKSLHRANTAVRTAINLLRLVFGVDYARDIRLAHVQAELPSSSRHAVEQDGKMHFVWNSRSSGALVQDNWYEETAKNVGFWKQAAHLQSTTVESTRSEIANRVIDALTWFEEAAFESAQGTQIVKFVAALERLTTTEWFSTHEFCTRVALLAYEDQKDLEQCYWNAYRIHQARSLVIHGASSPASPLAGEHVRLAHATTRYALFRGLEIHCVLDDRGGQSTVKELDDFFVSQQSKHASLFARLRKELKAKKG